MNILTIIIIILHLCSAPSAAPFNWSKGKRLGAGAFGEVSSEFCCLCVGTVDIE